MSHKVLVDTSVQSYFDSLFQNLPQEEVKSGLIIGQRSTAQDLIFSVFPTAAQENQTSTSIDEAWILEHAFQVSRMLCGGQFIMGLFLCTSFQRHNTLIGALQHVMTQLSKQNRSSLESQPDLASEYKDLLLFQLESNTKKLSCKLYNIEESKVNIKTTEMKVRSVLVDVHLLETNWTVELSIGINKDKILQEFIQNKINMECKSIMSSFAIEKGQPINSGESIVPASSEKKNKQGGAKKGNKKKEEKSFNGSIPVHAIDLLGVAGDVSETVEQSVGSITIKGHLAGKAYVSTKESWDTAAKYLKLDLARSLRTRFELLCETVEMAETDEKAADPKTPYFNPLVIKAEYLLPHTWLLPRRVFTASNHVLYCDYLSPSVDTTQDVVDRFNAMLAIKTEVDQLVQAESFRDDVSPDSEVMWSARPTKRNKGAKKEEKPAEVKRRISSELIAQIDETKLDNRVSALIAPPPQKPSKWYLAILVLVLAAVIARFFVQQ